MPAYRSDESTYEDHLDHFALAQEIGKMILDCEPPYVVGISGSWGSGKTGFLRKLESYLGGPTAEPPVKSVKAKRHRIEWFGADYKEPPSPTLRDFMEIKYPMPSLVHPILRECRQCTMTQWITYFHRVPKGRLASHPL